MRKSLSTSASTCVKSKSEGTLTTTALSPVSERRRPDVTDASHEGLDEDDGYLGMAAGTTIHDHDIALGYVLARDGGAIPCFERLDARQRAAIQFTQAELGFNHGQLVQAEAPPGALFSSMKRLLDAGGLPQADVAFYFVHWVTDLAGAEPTPAAGMEKFVLKFPQSVFVSLVSSMSLVQRLATTPPAALFYDFLSEAWLAAARRITDISALPSPTSGESWRQRVALMRLVVQAQTVNVQQMVCDAWPVLPAEDRVSLGEEMALTGVAGETYEKTPECAGGPAFLVYYSPAFIKIAAHESMVVALRMLAEIYRAARRLWPRTSDDAGKTVTIHIGKLRGLRIFSEVATTPYLAGRMWVLKRQSDNEGVVECEELDKMLSSSGPAAVLHFWSSMYDAQEGTGGEASPVGAGRV